MIREEYVNPVLNMDYSDPDVIRYGERFYMISSSFNYVPGIPILESTDLVDWQIVNYAVNKIPFKTYDSPAYGRGIWAPSIRYHNGVFYIFFGMPDEGIFMTCTEDILGKWSDIVCVKEGIGLIDPCPVWIDDRAYVVHAYAKSRIGYNSILGAFEMTTDATRCISEDRHIYDGRMTQPTIEGPKVYVKNKTIYILAPAGGVNTGWQTQLKADNIYGPYEEKIVMHQGSTDINGPHQGGLVDDIEGNWWFMHFQGKGAYGRIVHLQPAGFTDSGDIWIGVDVDGDSIGEPVATYARPAHISEERAPLKQMGGINMNWQWSGNYYKEFYDIDNKYFYLNAINRSSGKLLCHNPNILTNRIEAPDNKMTVDMHLDELMEGDCAGIMMLGSNYAAYKIVKSGKAYKLIYVTCEDEEDEKSVDIAEFTSSIVRLSIHVDEEGKCKYSCIYDDSEYTENYFMTKGAHWVGSRFGIYAISENERGGRVRIEVDII